MKTYFISDGHTVKIGRSNNPANRLRSLQTYNGFILELLLVLPTDREKELHQRFAKYRTRGEWFMLVFEIQKFIAEHRGDAPAKMQFNDWLAAQKDRRDDVGRFAVVVAADPAFPRSNRLGRYLEYYAWSDGFRRIIKYAHREWRQKYCISADPLTKVRVAWQMEVR